MCLPFTSWLLPLASLSLHGLRRYLSLKSQIWKRRFRDIKSPVEDYLVESHQRSDFKSSLTAYELTDLFRPKAYYVHLEESESKTH